MGESIIRFSGRRPIPERVKIGMEGEHCAETLRFVGLPQIHGSQTETLEIVARNGDADSILLSDHTAAFTRSHTQYTGIIVGYVTVQKSTDIVWKSEKICLEVGELPDADGTIEQAYPTAFEEAMGVCGELKSDTEAYAAGTRNGADVEEGDDAYHNNARYYAGYAEYSAGAAGNAAQDAEAWAKGTRDGAAVEDGDAAYHKNAYYYSELAFGFRNVASSYATQAANSKSDAEAFAAGTRNGTPVMSGDLAYNNFSKYYRTLAYNDAASAANHKKDAEAWAVGKRNGADVGSDDAAYHNNAKYYAEQAAAAAAAAIAPCVLNMTTEEGTGDVIIEAGDFTQVLDAWTGGRRIMVIDPDESPNRFVAFGLCQQEAEDMGTSYLMLAERVTFDGWDEAAFVFTQEDGQYIGRYPQII